MNPKAGPDRGTFPFDRGLVRFVQTHILAISAAALTVLSLEIRRRGLPTETPDYQNYFLLWFRELKEGGGLAALAKPVGDYTFPYLTVLAFLTYLPVSPLVSIKAFAIVFDYVGAAAAARIAARLAPDRERAKLLAVGAWLCVLFHPAVFLNSAYWAQCDSVYVSFLLLCVDSVLRDAYVPAFLWLSCAFSFQLQAVFLLPALLILYFTNRRHSVLHYLLIPAGMIVLSLPALIAGRSVADVFNIYFVQTQFKNLISSFPGLYYLMMGTYYQYAAAGLCLCAAFLGAGGALWIYRRKPVLGENVLLLGLWSSSICLYFLPSMHERYALFTVLLSVLYLLATRRHRLPAGLIALGWSFTVLMTYVNTVNLSAIRVPVDYTALSAVNLFLTAASSWLLVREVSGEAPAAA